RACTLRGPREAWKARQLYGGLRLARQPRLHDLVGTRSCCRSLSTAAREKNHHHQKSAGDLAVRGRGHRYACARQEQ
ncbi:unnamed protein product, partial [Scytosiphon promiscuus]